MKEKWAIAILWESQSRQELSLDVIEALTFEEALGTAIIKRQKESFDMIFYTKVKINKNE